MNHVGCGHARVCRGSRLRLILGGKWPKEKESSLESACKTNREDGRLRETTSNISILPMSNTHESGKPGSVARATQKQQGSAMEELGCGKKITSKD